jgi:Zn-dependent oligopeptidase
MIKRIKFYLMVLTDHLFLGTEASKVLDTYNEEDLQLTLVKTKFNTALKKLEDSMKLLRSSQVTEELATLDSDRDDAWMCFYNLVESQSLRLNLSIRQSAHIIDAIIKLPEMRIHHQGYKEQTTTMINFFNRVDTKPELSKAIEDIGAQTVYEELKAAQAAFETKQTEKVTQAAAKPKSESEAAVKELRKAFSNLSQFLNIMSQLSGKAEYNEIASKVNQLIDGVNTNVKSRSTRRENAKEELDAPVEN